MGFFDAPYEKLRLKLDASVAQTGLEVIKLAAATSSGLTFHQSKELEYVVFMAWLQQCLSRNSSRVLGRASLADWSRTMDQAHRIGAHFTPEQGAAFDACFRHLRSYALYGIAAPGED